MALESSGGIRSSTTTPKLRSSSLIVLSAGAALVALISFLYMKKKQQHNKCRNNSATTTAKSSDKNMTMTMTPSTGKKKLEEEKDETSLLSIATKNVVTSDQQAAAADLEKISQDLVRIVLNCATKKLNGDVNPSISYENEPSTSSSCKSTQNEADIIDDHLDATTKSTTKTASSESHVGGDGDLIESETTTPSSSSSSDNSLVESPKSLSYHHHHHLRFNHHGNCEDDDDEEEHQNVPEPAESTSRDVLRHTATDPNQTSTHAASNLIKSSSTTSTASSSSSAAIYTSNQAVPPSSKSSKQHYNKNNGVPQKNHSHHHNNSIESKPNKASSKATTPSLTTSTEHTTATIPSSPANINTAIIMNGSGVEHEHQKSSPFHNGGTSTTTNGSVISGHEDIVVYEFNFPRKFCGKLIGKNGIHVDFIRSKTRTQIAVRDDPDKHEQQIVCVSGRLEDVDQALDIISSRFPLKQYPNVSFKPISKPIVYRRLSINSENSKRSALPFENIHVKKVLVAPNMFVDIKSAANEQMNVHVSAVVNASHVFIQVPSNSTYESLQKLDEHMLEVYGGGGTSAASTSVVSQHKEVPLMNEPVEYGSICVAPTSYGWHRAMVTEYLSIDEARQQVSNYNEKCGLVTVKFLDYGGYLTIPANQLRQLRSDFMLLPFQAVECYLDGIYVFQGTEEEGKKFLTEIIKGAQLKISLCGYAEDGIPLIKLFLTNDIYQNVNLNSELVNYSYAFHIDPILTATAEQQPTSEPHRETHESIAKQLIEA